MDINIKVNDKIAVGDETLIVCGNSDYTVNFELDAEWDAYEKKTMRVGYRNGKYKDVEFSGSSCALPVISKRPWIAVGLYAGQLHTTTPALFRCAECITDKDDEPIDKPEVSPYKLLTEAKKYFSKSQCPAYQIAGDYLSGSAIRQNYLETAIKWI